MEDVRVVSAHALRHTIEPPRAGQQVLKSMEGVLEQRVELHALGGLIGDLDWKPLSPSHEEPSIPIQMVVHTHLQHPREMQIQILNQLLEVDQLRLFGCVQNEQMGGRGLPHSINRASMVR